MIKISIKTILLFALSLILFGCTKPDPNPHLSDYIYQDLKSKLAEAEALKTTQQSALSDFQKKLADEDKQSIQLKILRRKVEGSTWDIMKTEQQINYLKMKIFDREKFVRESYIEAFKKGEKWDNTNEVNEYKKSLLRDKAVKGKAAPTAQEKKPPAHNEEGGE